MIHKSFFRKKTTKIYILVLTLICILIGVLIVGKNYYISLGNKSYSDSYLLLKSGQDVKDKLNKIKNIKNLKIGFETTLNSQTVILLGSEEIQSENGILISNNYEEEIEKNSEIRIDNHQFYVENYYNFKNGMIIFYIHEQALNKIISQEKVYVFELKNWIIHEATIKELKETLNIDSVSTFLNNKKEINYSQIIMVFNIFVIIMIIIFSIVFIITSYNILEDEKQSNLLYHYLGFSKKQTFWICFKKIFSVLLIALIIGFVFFLILSKLLHTL